MSSNGNPGIAYRHSDGIKFAACNNATCTSASTHLIESGAGLSGETSLVYGNQGYPLVAYYHAPDTGLKLATCTSECTFPHELYQIDNSPGAVSGRNASISLKSDGTPFIGFTNLSTGKIQMANCIQPTCSWFNNGNNNNGISGVGFAGSGQNGSGTIATANIRYSPGILMAYRHDFYGVFRVSTCQTND